MATLGYSTTPSSGVWTDTVASSTQYWITDGFVMPSGGGSVTNYSFYGKYVNAQHGVLGCIWSGTTLVWSGWTGELTSGMSWAGKSISGLYLPAGTYYLGFWAAGTVNTAWEVAPGGTNGGVQYQRVASASNRGASGDEYSGQGFGCFGCYITYTPGGIIHAERSGAWANSSGLNMQRSGAWSSVQSAQRWKSGAWQEAT